MAKSWFLDGRTIARNVKTTGLPSIHQIKDCEASFECPQCGYRIDDYNNVSNEWPGLPIGVKFDPSDVELLEHLAAKCGVGNKKPHPYIDEFILTLDGEEGICYEHPENLPGARKDGNVVHFFYRTTNAYTKGQRKRRKIHGGSSLIRWHKTGKTKSIFKNGLQLGYKKIMVLYGASDGSSKPSKRNWVMHQYHLGTDEDEKDGEYVVSKVFYQVEKGTKNISAEQTFPSMRITSPRTPMINAPDPPRPGKSQPYQDVSADYVLRSPSKESKCFEENYLPPFSTNEVKDDKKEANTCKDEKLDLDVFHISFSGQDNLNAYSTSNILCANDVVGAARDANLENLDLGSPLDFNLSELYFPSEDSFCDGLDWL
ncbi:unnamed protein product [Lactuca virosa]|uniref:NAC domain-containing protein n=1 Tax=Lactuca virosa TaxID=75947 RepID=A0AAU9LKC9_9ASTR|nr:unnamed protein product [Lactuca virosa]